MMNGSRARSSRLDALGLRQRFPARHRRDQRFGHHAEELEPAAGIGGRIRPMSISPEWSRLSWSPLTISLAKSRHRAIPAGRWRSARGDSCRPSWR